MNKTREELFLLVLRTYVEQYQDTTKEELFSIIDQTMLSEETKDQLKQLVKEKGLINND